MRPVSVRFRCFGPYMEEQFIDFEKLRQNRLFLICGETGSGKTTILDAMCYALYGRSSGGLRGDISVMRCKLAGKEDVTEVEFIFDCGGRRYKFTRSLRMARKNIIDSHNCLEFIDGQYVPIFENPKATNVNKKAEEIIGLTYDQFRQVILLPQGQFEKLLVSDSSDKEKILVSLFRAEHWQRIAEEIYRRVNARAETLKQNKIAIDTKLQEHGCSNTEELQEKITAETCVLDTLSARALELEKSYRQLRTKYEEALVESLQYGELKQKEAVLKTLLARKAKIEAEERLIALAEASETMKGPYAAYKAAEESRARAEKEASRAKAAHAATEKTYAAAQKARANHEQGRESYENARNRLSLLQNSREVYHALTGKMQVWAAAELARKKTEEIYSATEGNLSQKDKAWQNALLQQSDAMETYQAAQRVYLNGIGSTLAEKLVDGAPCPVCGSTEHPAPANPGESHISEAELEALNKAQKKAGDTVSEALNRRMDAERERNAAQSALNTALNNESQAKAEYDALQLRRIEGVDSEAALESEIDSLTAEITAYENAEALTADALHKSAQEEGLSRAMLERLSHDLQEASKAFLQQEEQWLALLETSDFDSAESFAAALMEPEELRRRTEDIVRYHTELKATQAAAEAAAATVKGRTEPNLTEMKRALDEAESANTDLNNETLLAKKRLDVLRADHTALTAKITAYDEAMLLLAEDQDFAKRLWGRTGVGIQRYVLGVMLTSITTAANRLLKNVYGGRYQLYRTDEVAGSGQKGGLELEVFDSAQNQRRSVTTLSGGEKFLMALGLAIGLSTVVQAQGGGVRPEAMFIDEGFGSLDRESVQDALEILQSVTGSTGIMGIISHVEQLAETIPAKIEITKGRNGSQSRMIC